MLSKQDIDYWTVRRNTAPVHLIRLLTLQHKGPATTAMKVNLIRASLLTLKVDIRRLRSRSRPRCRESDQRRSSQARGPLHSLETVEFLPRLRACQAHCKKAASRLGYRLFRSVRNEGWMSLLYLSSISDTSCTSRSL